MKTKHHHQPSRADSITVQDVREMNAKGFIVFPYPKKGRISVNGGASKPATKDALAEARKFLDSRVK